MIPEVLAPIVYGMGCTMAVMGAFFGPERLFEPGVIVALVGLGMRMGLDGPKEQTK